jgi:hypothetical protein
MLGSAGDTGDEVTGALKPTLAILNAKKTLKKGGKPATVPFDEKLRFIKAESPMIK